MSKKTFIFGHKKPDTDSITASISLSYLKNQLGDNTEPRALGSLNKETKYALKYFGVKEPQYLNDVKIQIKDVFSKEKKVIILLYKVGFKIKILFFNVSKIFSVTHKSLVKKCFNNIFFN
jgi:inorganic pyrophosphatase/exopolyphosphatase